MNAFLYKLVCITNLHVGSGDANYSVVDNEVEKDAVLDCPIIHSSGVKGALRDTVDPQIADSIFGSPATGKESNPGLIKFMDACILSRPLRAWGGNSSCIQVTTLDILNHFIRQATAFGCLPKELEGLKEFTVKEIEDAPFNNANFLCSAGGIKVEGETTNVLLSTFPQLDLLKKLLGSNFALAKSLDDFPLPVIARNKLENKVSKNLWYEEYVPHGSVFYLIMLAPKKEDLAWLNVEKPVQFGGNASVGCGYIQMTSGEVWLNE